jgi:hypothetical protein
MRVGVVVEFLAGINGDPTCNLRILAGSSRRKNVDERLSELWDVSKSDKNVHPFRPLE